MVPNDGSSRKLMQRSIVLFPDPLRPMMQTTSRGGTSIEIFLSTCRRPKYLSSLEILTIGWLSNAISAISFGEPRLDDALQVRQDKCHQPVKDRGHDQRLKASELCASHFYRIPHQFMYEAGRGDQSRVFCHGDKIISDGRNGEAQCLRQNDPFHRLSRSHSQCDRSLTLTFPHRCQTGAKYFTHICAIVQPESEYSSPKAGKNNSQLWQGKKEEKDLQI